MGNVGVYCLNRGLHGLTRILSLFQMYALPLQRNDMSIEYTEPKTFRSSGAVCDR